MGEQIALAEKCRLCGGIFDLEFDVRVMERMLSREEAIDKVFCELKKKDGSLCWECRSL